MNFSGKIERDGRKVGRIRLSVAMVVVGGKTGPFRPGDGANYHDWGVNSPPECSRQESFISLDPGGFVMFESSYWTGELALPPDADGFIESFGICLLVCFADPLVSDIC